jgi:hypothetical protein
VALATLWETALGAGWKSAVMSTGYLTQFVDDDLGPADLARIRAGIEAEAVVRVVNPASARRDESFVGSLARVPFGRSAGDLKSGGVEVLEARQVSAEICHVTTPSLRRYGPAADRSDEAGARAHCS